MMTNPTPKTETLTAWELLAIERSVVAHTRNKQLHQKYADALIEKLQRAESIRITYGRDSE